MTEELSQKTPRFLLKSLFVVSLCYLESVATSSVSPESFHASNPIQPCVKYPKTGVFTDPYIPYKDRVVDSVLIREYMG